MAHRYATFLCSWDDSLVGQLTNTSVAHPFQSGHVCHKIKQSPIYSGSKENLLLNIKLEPSHHDLHSNLKCVSYIVWAVLQIFPLVVREPPAI